jgi:molybdate transport system substrate-binding protein
MVVYNRLIRYASHGGWSVKPIRCVVVVAILCLSLCGFVGDCLGEEILVFAGAASKPPAEEAARVFESKTGIKVNLTFGGSGFVLSQMALGKVGDIYFPGSSDFMEVAKRKGLVFSESERNVVYLVPAINVQKGNPKRISPLKDLTSLGLRGAIANPDGVCVGLYAVEIVEKNLKADEKAAFRKNLVNYTESCEKTATAISLRAADAVIGWGVFQHWDPLRIQTIPLKKEEIVRVGYIPIAISKFTANRPRAQGFIDFVLSSEGQAIFRKYHYFMKPEEAFTWIGAKKPVGGEYAPPPEWSAK